jgi:hypothetical protein
MGVAALVNDFTRELKPPPSVDWAAVAVGDDLKRLEKSVDQFESSAIEWRATWLPNHARLLDRVKAEVMKGEEYDEVALNAALATLIQSLDGTIATLSRPMHEKPDLSEKITQLSRMSRDAGKFVRKLLRRVERTRVSLHALCVDMYYGILALESELDKDAQQQESFTDPAALKEFIRQKTA